MSTLPIKQNGRWTVGDNYTSDIVSTRAINLDRNPFLKASKKPVTIITKDESSGMGDTILSIFSDGTSFYFLSNANITRVDFDTPTIVATTGGPTYFLGSDGLMFNGNITVSGSSTVQTADDTSFGSWTSRITGLNSSYPHPMCVFENRNTLLVGNKNVVQQYSTGWSEDTTNKLTLPSQYIVMWIRYRQSFVYIGTRNISGEAKVFVWNGVGASAQQGYGVGADWAYSGVEYSNSIATITSAGQLLRFNGGGFDEIAHLPVYETPYSWSNTSAGTTNAGKVVNRGLATHGDTLYINLNGELDTQNATYPGDKLVNQPSGIWKYEPNVGLYHAYGAIYKRRVETNISSLSSNTLTLASSHGLTTGDPVWATSVAGIDNLQTNQLYFAIVTSSTAIKLALTPADALAGRFIPISGTISTQYVRYDTYETFGATYNVKNGAVFPLIFKRPPLFQGTELLYGVAGKDESNNYTPAFHSVGFSRGIGSFDTTWIPSNHFQDVYKNVIQRLDEFYASYEYIKVSYRTKKKNGFPTLPAFVTWTSTTTFTVDSEEYDAQGWSQGDYIEVVSGNGSGMSSYISSINTSSNTYTVTIEDALPVSNGNTGYLFVDNFTKLVTITKESPNTLSGHANTLVSAKSSKIQLKFEIYGTPSLEKIEVVNQANK